MRGFSVNRDGRSQGGNGPVTGRRAQADSPALQRFARSQRCPARPVMPQPRICHVAQTFPLLSARIAQAPYRPGILDHMPQLGHKLALPDMCRTGRPRQRAARHRLR